MIAVASEMTARGQFVAAIFTAESERESPMSMMIGPMTTGGKRREMKRRPKRRIRSDITKYTALTPIQPKSAPLSP